MWEIHGKLDGFLPHGGEFEFILTCTGKVLSGKLDDGLTPDERLNKYQEMRGKTAIGSFERSAYGEVFLQALRYEDE